MSAFAPWSQSQRRELLEDRCLCAIIGDGNPACRTCALLRYVDALEHRARIAEVALRAVLNDNEVTALNEYTVNLIGAALERMEEE